MSDVDDEEVAGGADDDDNDDEEIMDPAEQAEGSMLKFMAYEQPTESYASMSKLRRSMRERRQQEVSEDNKVDPGLKLTSAADKLRQLLRRRHGSVTAGWRHDLDVRGAHFVTQIDFFRALQEIGYGGGIKHAWFDLGGAKKGQITLADVDEEAAKVLGEFYRLFKDKTGLAVSVLVDGCDSRRAGKEHFLDQCRRRIEYAHGQPKLDFKGVFQHLQTGSGAVTAEDLAWLASYVDRRAAPEESIETEEPSAFMEERAKARALIGRKRAAEEFRALLRKQYGSLPKAWRELLDLEQKGEIGWEELETACASLDFKFEINTLWEALVGEIGEVITLRDLEPALGPALDNFRARCCARFGNLVKALADFEAAKKPLVTRVEFLRLCQEIRLEVNPHLLLDFYDDKGMGLFSIAVIDAVAAEKAVGESALNAAKQDLTVMEAQKAMDEEKERERERRAKDGEEPVKEPRKKKVEAPKKQQRPLLIKILEDRFQSPVRAWSAVFDLKDEGRITKKEFKVGCAIVGFSGNVSALCTELGLDAKGAKLKFEDFAPEVLEELRNFKASAGRKIADLVKSVEGSGNPKLAKIGMPVDPQEFRDFCTTIKYAGDVQRLMYHLDPSGIGHMTTKTFRLLAESKTEEKALPALVKKNRELKQMQWHAKLGEARVQPAAEVTEKQDALFEKSRAKRGEIRSMANIKLQFLRELQEKCGSVGRGWRLALDPRDHGEIQTPADLLKGLKRAGMAPTAEDSTQQVSDLFKALCNKDNVITLEVLDPHVHKLMEEVCLKAPHRYGSLKAAFMALDPEGTGVPSAEAFKLFCHSIKVSDGVHRLIQYLDPKSENRIDLAALNKEARDKAITEIKKEQLRLANKAADEQAAMEKAMKKRRRRTAGDEPPPALNPKEKAEGLKILQELKQKLVRKHGSLSAAWRAVIDPEITGEADQDSIREALQDVGMSREKGELVYQVFETNILTLQNWDEGAAKDFEDLKLRIIERFGNMETAITETNTRGTHKLDFKGFLAFCYECQFRGNERNLFDYLDQKGKKYVNFATIDEAAVQRVEDKIQKRLAAIKRKQKAALKAARGDDYEEPDEEEEEPEEGDDEEKESELPPPPPRFPLSRGPSPAQLFREQMLRKFGSLVKAWRVLDHQNLGAINQQEFMRAVAGTGYAGSASLLWQDIVNQAAKRDGEDQGQEKKTLITMADIDDTNWALIKRFRLCFGHHVGRKSKLLKAFQKPSADGEPPTEITLSLEDFVVLCCQKVHFTTKAAEARQLFAQLDTRGLEELSYEDVRFLDEQWRWQDGEAKPLRTRKEDSSMSRSTMSSPRTEGHLLAGMRPRKVTLQKSSSLPTLRVGIRPSWHERHHVATHLGNSDSNMIYLYTKVLTQDMERIHNRCKQKMEEVSTLDWVREQQERQARQDLGLDDEEDY